MADVSYRAVQFALDFADGSRVEGIRVIPSAVRAIEAEHGQPFSEVATFNREDWMLLAAWTFLRVRRGEVRPFDEWLDTVDEIQIATVDDTDRPTSGLTPALSGSSKQRSKKAKTSAV